MFYRWLVLLSICLGTQRSYGSDTCTVNDYLCRRNSILAITYGPFYNVYCDVQLSKNITFNKPAINFPGGVQGNRYLLVMVDPDAPEGCSVHNLEITRLLSGHLMPLHTVVSYFPPSPPHRVHRYQFFLYPWVQSGYDLNYEGHPFNLTQFVDQNNLDQPVGVFQIMVGPLFVYT